MKKQTARKASKKRKIRRMTDKPKPWPYAAAEARDRSAEEAQSIARQAEDSLEMTNDPGLLKKIGRILVSASVILRLLEGQGAKTRPPEK